MTYTPATLTGHFEKSDGSPAQGRVEIIPNSAVIIDTASNVVLSGRLKVTLDETGSFSVAVPPTDDATLEPATNRQYTIVVKLNHTSDVPVLRGVTLNAGTTHDYADLLSGIEATVSYSAFFTQSDLDDLLAADTTNASALTAEALLRAQGDQAVGQAITNRIGASSGIAPLDSNQHLPDANLPVRLTAVQLAHQYAFVDSAPPPSPGLNQVWIDVGTLPPIFKYWNGVAWIAWAAGAGAGDALTPIDNGDGGISITPSGAASVVDNGDGIITITSASIADNGDGILTIAA